MLDVSLAARGTCPSYMHIKNREVLEAIICLAGFQRFAC